MNTLEDPPVVEKEKAKKKTATPNFSEAEYKRFIKENLPTIERPILKISMANVTPSYWRVNVWGKKQNSTIAFGDNEIIMSKFLRIDIDKNGNMVYNDMTDGKSL